MNSTPTYQTAVDEAEIRSIEATWGTLPRQQQWLIVDHPFLTGEHQLLVSDGRRAEICYIMHRGNVDDGVLLHVKTFYPTGAYRLPTGGIHQGEQVMETLAREIEEETGMLVGSGVDHVQVQRCLGMVSYEMEHRGTGQTYPFATYHFLVQMPQGGVLAPRDATEQIGGWQWRKPQELLAVAEYLERVGSSHPAWADWGRYRALSHRFVASQLSLGV